MLSLKDERLPKALVDALRPVTVIVGHYGTGKTNLAINLAIDLARAGNAATLIDLDVVNPYFRASEQRVDLESEGVKLIAPVFAEAGTSLDVPSLTGRIVPAIEEASDDSVVIIDAGGDDVGATALGRFARYIAAKDYAMICVLNRYRNLVQDPEDALENLREIEEASHLKATGLISNAHMKAETAPSHIKEGLRYAHEVEALCGLPLAAYTVPRIDGMTLPFDDDAIDGDSASAYHVNMHVRTPWER